jgi:hypothetical protein
VTADHQESYAARDQRTQELCPVAELINFAIERQRHRRFVGREDVLEETEVE